MHRNDKQARRGGMNMSTNGFPPPTRTASPPHAHGAGVKMQTHVRGGAPKRPWYLTATLGSDSQTTPWRILRPQWQSIASGNGATEVEHGCMCQLRQLARALPVYNNRSPRVGDTGTTACTPTHRNTGS